MPDVYINGEFVPEEEAKISIFDRAVQLGDGLFETIRAHLGKPAFLGEHLLRMRASAEFLQILFDLSDTEIRDALIELCKRNNAPEARIRLTLTRGRHPGGLSLAGGEHSFIATAQAYTPHSPEKYEAGYKLIISTIMHYSKSPLAGHKTLNYMEFLLARDEAAQTGADEALLLNELGNVAECSSANIFCISGGTLITPDLASGILPGVVRGVVIKLAQDAGVSVSQEPVPLEKLLGAQEVFITSSLRGIMPVAQIDKTQFAKERPLTEKLSALYSGELDAACRD